ncbi:hypothetical protein GpartN1_g1763.t1 [Galdieria partita]|uniref:Thymocyte nuclear protein 1 n=1 Tax=Galdieria partita TaxID=83374 RepID=A0A9C7PUR2_9RHOD|nr:hypothetical protein GpartN1_g1763.t1 [Galdieria partita]
MTKRKRTISTVSQSKQKETKENNNSVEQELESCRQFFLLKSEPESRLEKGVDVRFSIQDLENEPDQSATWDGVRNYQARNILKSMKVGDLAFFYHSNCKEPGIVGVVRITKEAFPDPTQFDPKSPYYDPKSRKESPSWFAVQVKLEERWNKKISLNQLKNYQTKQLSGMDLFKRSRLSVQKVLEYQRNFILELLNNENNTKTAFTTNTTNYLEEQKQE